VGFDFNAATGSRTLACRVLLRDDNPFVRTCYSVCRVMCRGKKSEDDLCAANWQRWGRKQSLSVWMKDWLCHLTKLFELQKRKATVERLELLFHIQEVEFSNLGSETDCLYWGFLWFLAYFPKKESEAYEITRLSVCPSVCMCVPPPLITFEPVGRFLWNSVGRSCHWRWPRRHTY
jgi:hypothetical protein